MAENYDELVTKAKTNATDKEKAALAAKAEYDSLVEKAKLEQALAALDDECAAAEADCKLRVDKLQQDVNAASAKAVEFQKKRDEASKKFVAVDTLARDIERTTKNVATFTADSKTKAGLVEPAKQVVDKAVETLTNAKEAKDAADKALATATSDSKEADQKVTDASKSLVDLQTKLTKATADRDAMTQPEKDTAVATEKDLAAANGQVALAEAHKTSMQAEVESELAKKLLDIRTRQASLAKQPA